MRVQLSFVSRERLSVTRKCSSSGCLSSYDSRLRKQCDLLARGRRPDARGQGTFQNVSAQVSSVNGFVGTIQITMSNLPSGISAAPFNIDLASGTGTGTLRLSATTRAAIVDPL